MPKKQSYMNKGSVLSEGFFDKLSKIIGKLKPSQKNELKKNKKFKSALLGLNNSVSDIEKAFSDTYGTDVKLDKFKLSDFV
jgi:hypothetical protein|tara:strand:+ start:60 stop:302 length:243 start_codon:yes stop_codon:yes gene_type:complete